VGKSGVLQHAISLKRVKIDEQLYYGVPIGTRKVTNALLNGTIPDHTPLLFLDWRFAAPPP